MFKHIDYISLCGPYISIWAHVVDRVHMFYKSISRVHMIFQNLAKSTYFVMTIIPN